MPFVFALIKLDEAVRLKYFFKIGSGTNISVGRNKMTQKNNRFAFSHRVPRRGFSSHRVVIREIYCRCVTLRVSYSRSVIFLFCAFGVRTACMYAQVEPVTFSL